ncbi:MAG: hypothetical protein IIA40_09820 [SAR324 cluster bacterium]|nr:hypothetical protein [SAR324 cluster bacterium]
MNGSKAYVAILKGKDAEFKALSQIPDNVSACTTFFFDVPRPANPNKVDSHLIDIADNIFSASHFNAPFYVDIYDTHQRIRTAGDLLPLMFLLQHMRGYFLTSSAIPVTGLKRGTNFNTALRNEVKFDGHGVCIRLLREDMEVTRFLKGSIAELLDTLSIAPGDYDFLLDFRHLEGSEIINAAEVAVATINNLELWYKSRRLILAASGFPDSFSKIGSFEVASFRRTELDLWQAVCNNPELSRKPVFADYGATPPRTAYLDKEAKRRMSGNIRLTLGDEFRIWKGGLFATYRSEQYRKLAEMVINDPHVKYKLYGPVLDRLERCAMNMVKPEKSRKMDRNRHYSTPR